MQSTSLANQSNWKKYYFPEKNILTKHYSNFFTSKIHLNQTHQLGSNEWYLRVIELHTYIVIFGGSVPKTLWDYATKYRKSSRKQMNKLCYVSVEYNPLKPIKETQTVGKR